MFGGAGDDTFIIAAGAHHNLILETIAGGDGYDVIRFTSTTAGDFLTLNPNSVSGVEAVIIGTADGDTSGTTTLGVNARFVLGGGITIIGNDGANFMNGTLFSDSFFGNGGDDTFAAGSGDNLIDGGSGSDTVIFNGFRGVLVDLGAGYAVADGETTDTLISIENVEASGFNDTLIGSAAANRLLGLTGADTLSGLDGDDYLDGGAGADSMVGGLGDDTYIVDNAADNTLELADQGIDTVVSSMGFTALGDNLENLTLTGGVSTGVGNALANVILGSASNNVLDGAAGADTMAGGLGDDWYDVDNAGDSVIENAGSGHDTVRSSVSYALTDHV